MKINEIKPSDFKTVRDISSIATKEKHVPGDDLIGQKLEAKGFKFVKQGGFSDVYETPDQTAIVKYNRLPDKCYEKFMAYILKDPKNPALPRITKPFNFTYDNGYDGFVVVMEKLEPLHESLPRPNFEALRLFLAYQHVKLHSQGKEESITRAKTHLGTLTPEQKSFIFKFAKKHIHAIREYHKLLAALPTCEVDIHTGNFMIRPTTGDLVIADPVAWFKE